MVSRISVVGALRAAVGVALLAAPRTTTRLDDPAALLLIRTIGVRDLVLGAGALLSGGSGGVAWGRAALVSDSLDVLVGSASIARVGVSGGLVAALLPVPFAAADAWALREPGA